MIFNQLFVNKIFTFVPMFRRKETKQIFATFITALYLFVALFSQNFHDHEKIVSFSKADSSSVEKNNSHSQLQADSANCLSCHFLYTGNSFFPQEFQYEFHSIEFVAEKICTFEAPFVTIATQVLYLRGPPNDLI